MLPTPDQIAEGLALLLALIGPPIIIAVVFAALDPIFRRAIGQGRREMRHW